MRCACTHEMPVTTRRIGLEVAGQPPITIDDVEVYACLNCSMVTPTESGRRQVLEALGVGDDDPLPRVRVFVERQEAP